MTIQIINETVETSLNDGDNLSDLDSVNIDVEFINGYIEDIFLELSDFENTSDTSEQDVVVEGFSNGLNEFGAGSQTIDGGEIVGVVTTNDDVWVYDDLPTDIKLDFGESSLSLEATTDNPEITLQIVVRGV